MIDDAAAQPEAKDLIRVIGKYPSTDAHDQFVHVDVRDGKPLFPLPHFSGGLVTTIKTKFDK